MQQTIAKDTEQMDGIVRQYLTFMLVDKTYGLDILNIKEIIEYGEVTEVPMTPDFIAGVINLRGSVVPVIDLIQRFTNQPMQVTKRTSIVILEVEDDDLKIEFGVTVDKVNQVLDINTAEIEPAPTLGNQINASFISGMAKIQDKLLIILNIEKVMTIDELSMVGSIQQTLE